MSIITNNTPINSRWIVTPKFNLSFPFWNMYLEYARRQSQESILWYLKVVIIIPCVLMVPAIIFMSMAMDQYIWFVGLTVSLFFINLISHIVGAQSTFFVPLYHLTVLAMILIPGIAYMI